MQLKGLLTKLGYQDSPNFLRAADPHTQTVPDYGHVFRKATTRPGPRLHGVYVLRPDQIGTKPGNSVVPVVYVCEAQTESDAEEIHRLVWNQDVVPFIIVYSPQGVRLYSGFRYHRPSTGGIRGLQEGVLRVLTDFYRIDELVEGFSANAIDSGAIWRQWGKEVQPEQRLERSLLRNLRELDKWLRNNAHLPPEVSHALIGKYVYLHYLRDRNILSDQKLQRFGLVESDIFGRTAKLPAIRKIIDYLEDWLNGRVFPLDFTGGVPTEDHVRHVAGVFRGDEIQQDGSSQLHLDFKAYDFSYIPIETLSIVYEQFLHAKVEEGKPTKAKEAGAYYTPIPLVNFMLSELEDRHPLQQGMRVLDASCGSGAFLVQCYRRLIEKTFPPNTHPSPGQLRDILEKHIFGVDRDPDACSVTELSLILTLLDYVNPPDLENGSRQQFELPSLRGQNIHQADFFNTQGDWHGVLTRKKFDWIVGNPPWKKLNPAKLRNDDQPAWQWMVNLKNKTNRPVGKYEVGQAFAWEIGDYLAEDGAAAMLLPAMGLFEDPSRAFRAAFFQTFDVHRVANFSNLAEVLFAGRSRVPAAAFFYRTRPPGPGSEPAEDSRIAVYSPLVANQEATRPLAQGKRNDTWNLVLNASELRSIRTSEAASGSALSWKLAAWGSEFDRKLLFRLQRALPSLGDLGERGLIAISQGLELRRAPRADLAEEEEVELVEEIHHKKVIDMKRLRARGRLFVFPPDALLKVAPELTHVRKGRATLPLAVCRPPHVIVGGTRSFAVYTDDFLIVPHPQVGIISPRGNRALLKALSLYLSSDFAFYHQFFTSTHFGVQRGVATLHALRTIPCPLDQCSTAKLSEWATFHDQIAEASAKRIAAGDAEPTLFEQTRPRDEFAQLMDELNNRVADLLGLTDRERALVADFVGIRYALNDGKLGPAAVDQPTQAQLKTYAKRLKSELDTFVEGVLPKRHEVGIVFDKLSASAMVSIDFSKNTNGGSSVIVVAADSEAGKELDRARRRLQQKRSQWVYFNRNLRGFEGTRTYLFKPMQRFHWTETQAMIDAAEVISATLASGGGKL